MVNRERVVLGVDDCVSKDVSQGIGMAMAGKADKAALMVNKAYLDKKKAKHEELKMKGRLVQTTKPEEVEEDVFEPVPVIPKERTMQDQITEKVSSVVTKVIDKVVDKMVSEMESKLTAAFGLEEPAEEVAEEENVNKAPTAENAEIDKKEN